MVSNVAQCKYLLSLALPLMADLGDEHLALEPVAGVKTAGWLLGHLVVTGDFARTLCGRQPYCPREWGRRFRPGTYPSHERHDYPSMEELRSAFRPVYEDVCSAAVDADPAQLARENPYEPGRPAFPTAGDFVGYLLAAHFGYHLGQLVFWRVAAGLQNPVKAMLGVRP